MNKLFWIIPGKLAGRAGPDREPWDLATLRDGGVGAILSVNNGVLCRPEDFEVHDINYACIPLSANEPPFPGDDEICMAALPKAYGFAKAQMAKGRGVLVHCSAGKDRTGLFLCYFVMQHEGLSPKDAISRIRKLRSIALSALGWEEFAEQVLTHLENNVPNQRINTESQ